MFDHTEEDTLLLGVRYEGPRTPSKILSGIGEDLETATSKLLEYGYDWVDIVAQPMIAEAFLALLKARPELDVTLAPDDEMVDYDHETLVIAQVIGTLMGVIEQTTPPLTRYGWFSDDPDDPGYEALGLWPDWDEINKELARDRVIRADDTSILDEYRDEMINDGVVYLLIEEDGDDILVSVTTGEEVWRY